MTIRWKRWAGAAAAAIATYAAFGFWAVPHIARRQLASYAHEHLQRQAGVGQLTFNPFTLRMQAGDVRLAEADGAPIVAIGRLVVEMQWRSLFTGTWRFAEIELDHPTASLTIAPDGRFNIAQLVADATRGSPPSHNPSLPRVLIQRLALEGGRIDMQDRRAGYANTLTPIDFEVAGFSTLPDRKDEYLLTAASKRGGTLRWRGHSSVDPIRADGELAVEGVSLPDLSVYLRSKVRATVAAGQLSARLPYSVSYADGRLEARLQGAQVTARDLALAREGKTDSFAALTQLTAQGVDADLTRLDFNVKELRAQGGRLAVRRDAKGNLDLADLMVQAAGPAAAPAKAKPVQATAWKANVEKIALDGVAVTALDETLSPPLKFDAAAVQAQLAMQAAQQGDALHLKIANASLALSNLAVAKGSRPAQQIARAGFEGGSLDLAARRVELGRVYAEGAQLHVVRDRSGALELAGWMPKPGAPSSETSAKPATPWTASVHNVQLSKVDAQLADEQSGTQLHVVDAHAQAEGAGTDLDQPMKFDASLSLREGGQFAGHGSVVPATGAVQAQVKASRLPLKSLQPLLGQYVKLRIANGSVSAQGRLTAGGGARNAPLLRYDGSFDVDGVTIREVEGEPFALWRNIGAARLTASVSPNRLEIPELRIVGADAKLIIDEDRSFNAARLLVKRDTRSAKPAPAASGAEPFPVRIRRVRIEDAKLDFTDLSLRPQFAAKIQNLSGVVNGLSTSRSARAQIELDGRVDEFGMARIRGETSLGDPKDNTDVNFVFRNVDMVPASPYSMKFAGYRIAEGKISLDLQYRIRNAKLEGDNRIVIDKLRLGERVDSPDAMKIPLELALAVLKDADGRIDLGLPVSGDLNDPQFSYSAIIWKAIGNVLTKIVTAPFRALGAALGMSGDKLEAIDFDAGSATLHPPEREKLKQVAQILAKRAGLKLSVPGQYSPAADGAALRARAVRLEVAQQAGIKLKSGEEPGPLDFGDRNIRTALRELYAKRFGDAELEKAKKAAESAPATSTDSASQNPQAPLPLWQRAAKMIQGEPQVADASAFYNHLRERLEREHPLPPDALAQLGAERAKVIAAALAEAGADAARLSLAHPEAADTPAGKVVPVKLSLAAG
jgi:uncharacterized protein involved in outer membrane biogenesis